MHFLAFSILGKRIRAIPRFLRDKTVKRRKKALVIVSILFLLFPTIIVFPMGFIGKAILWVWLLWYLRDELDLYWKGPKPVDLSRTYRGKTIIRDVDFEVHSERKK